MGLRHEICLKIRPADRQLAKFASYRLSASAGLVYRTGVQLKHGDMIDIRLADQTTSSVRVFSKTGGYERPAVTLQNAHLILLQRLQIGLDEGGERGVAELSLALNTVNRKPE